MENLHRSIIFMFSGQGSQYYHMGAELYQHHPIFRKWMHNLDHIVQGIIGDSILGLIYDERKQKSDLFQRLLFSNPAIFMVEYALAQVLLEDGIHPDYVLGSSMGEYASAAVAGVMGYEEALVITVKKAKVMEEHTTASGGMLTILHASSLYYEMPALYENSELAAVDFDSHFVVSGKREGLDCIKTFLKEKEITYQTLDAAAAYHSSLMDSAASVTKSFLETHSFKPPEIPYISCTYGHELTELPKYHFWDAIRKPILFQKTIQNMEDGQGHVYLDLGPSGTLATFVKYNLAKDSQSISFPILTPFGGNLKNLEKVKGYLSKQHLTRSSRSSKEEEKMRTFVFPGQGSQMKGMGGKLFDDFRELVSKADAILGYSIKELCLEDPHRNLGQTQYTQLAVYVVNALSYIKRTQKDGNKPDYVAGHSLGEYNALFAAGVFDFETGVKLVKKRGELMAQAKGGGMAAVVGLGEERVEEILKESGLKAISIANYNTPSQVVIAGPREDIARATPFFEAAGSAFIPLNVSAAFHTQYMQKAKEEFEIFLNEFEFSAPGIPVISNCDARPYKNTNIKEKLMEQITKPVKWTESIRYLMAQGDMEFEEVGHGEVLTKLIQKIRDEMKPLHLSAAKEDEKQDVKDETGKGRTTQKAELKKSELAASKTTKLEMPKKARIESLERILPKITAQTLGNEEFKKEYNVRYAYVAGGMYRGIASKDMVVKMGKSGMIGYFGTGGLDLSTIEEAIQYIQEALKDGQAHGMNLLNSPVENETVDLFLKYGIRNIEAAAYIQITPALVRYRLKGLSRTGKDGAVQIKNRIEAKVSRPEVAELFLSPAPKRVVQELLKKGTITEVEAELSKVVPMADDLCVEADSGGHTDQGVAYVLMPAMLRLRDEIMEKHGYSKKIRIGAAGGIGTPEAAAAAFILGADFILTGSINQCTVEAGTSDAVKDLLQQMNVQDTEYAPAGDMFEMGAKVQVLRKGLFFPARANKLYNIYQQYNSLDEIDEKTKTQLQEKFFRRTFDQIYKETKAFFSKIDPEEIEKAERNPKHKMALVFRWYFDHSSNLALSGSEEQKVDYQVQCGPALGAFNQWVKGTRYENWRDRQVDEIAVMLMEATAELLNKRFQSFV